MEGAANGRQDPDAAQIKGPEETAKRGIKERTFWTDGMLPYL